MNTTRHPALALLRRTARIFVSLLVGTSLLSSGCTTMQSVAVPTPSGPPPAVRVGDHVEVQTKQGRTLAFAVTRLEADALVGKDVRVPLDDIAGLQVKRVDKLRTGAAVVGAGLVAGLVILLSHGIAFMPSGPS